MGGAATRLHINASRAKVRNALAGSNISIPQSKTFQATFAPKHTSSLHRLPWVMEDQQHPLHEKAVANEKLKSRTGLWWSIVAPAAVAQKRTVRSWLQRRMKVAFEEALEERGFDRCGLPLSAEKQTAMTGSALYGSLRIMAKTPSITATKSVLDAEFGNLIDAIGVRDQRHSARSILAAESRAQRKSTEKYFERVTVVRYDQHHEQQEKTAAAG